MQKYHILSRCVGPETITIVDKSQIHHIVTVARLREGERVGFFDEAGAEYVCTMDSVTKDALTLRILERTKAVSQARAVLTVACAIPKNTKFEDVIDKLTQLGVDRIIPLMTERVVVRLNAQKARLRHMRWQRIVQAASRQCQRPVMPRLDEVTKFKDIITCSEYDLKLIPHLTGKRQSIAQVVSRAAYRNILMLIGPEGDFSPEEINSALDAGFIPVTLGSTVLRVDTAAIAAAAYVRLNETL